MYYLKICQVQSRVGMAEICSLTDAPCPVHDKCTRIFRKSINQSINVEFVGRRYTTRPGAPAESVKSTIKKYILESFSKCTGISNIMKVGWIFQAAGLE